MVMEIRSDNVFPTEYCRANLTHSAFTKLGEAVDAFCRHDFPVLVYTGALRYWANPHPCIVRLHHL